MIIIIIIIIIIITIMEMKIIVIIMVMRRTTIIYFESSRFIVSYIVITYTLFLEKNKSAENVPKSTKDINMNFKDLICTRHPLSVGNHKDMYEVRQFIMKTCP